MKVLLLAPATVVHTQRWANALVGRGARVLLVTQHPADPNCISPDVETIVLPHNGTVGYFLNARALRQIASAWKPDLLNAHYASGYGTTMALARMRPSLLSVWGSDVFDFPYESWVAARLIRWNLRHADRIASTSHVMAEQVRRLAPDVGDIDVTPFGVECDRFQPRQRAREGDRIVIGTVKTLADKYGVDVLIDAFAQLLQDADPMLAGVRERLALLLVGDGPDRAKLESQVDSLGIRARVSFAGKVAHAEVPSWLNRLDVYVAASRLDSESFGVAVIEASSCGLPVVVSDAGGLPEVVRDGVTGLVVPRNDSRALCAALKRLVVDEELRSNMGRAGRALVQHEYEWEACVDKMLASYASAIQQRADHHGVGAAR
jgi:L-malate glycosyltransferase